MSFQRLSGNPFSWFTFHSSVSFTFLLCSVLSIYFHILMSLRAYLFLLSFCLFFLDSLISNHFFCIFTCVKLFLCSCNREKVSPFYVEDWFNVKKRKYIFDCENFLSLIFRINYEKNGWELYVRIRLGNFGIEIPQMETLFFSCSFIRGW